MKQILLLFASSAILAQTFDAVNISQASPTEQLRYRVSPGFTRFSVEGTTIPQLVRLALPSNEGPVMLDHIVGKFPPGTWDISAVSPNGADLAYDDGSSKPAFRVMLLRALQDEFGLTFSVQRKEEKACVLETAPSGLKIKKSLDQKAPFSNTGINNNPAAFERNVAIKNARGEYLVNNFLGGNNRCANLGIPEVSDLPLEPGTKYDLNLTYVDRDFAERVNREAEASRTGPDKFTALKDQAGVVVSVKKHLIPYFRFEWSGKLPKQ